MNKNFTKLTFLILFAASFVASAIYTARMQQKNPESIFLTDEGMRDYTKFQDEYPEAESLVVFENMQEAQVNLESYKDFLLKIKKIEEICDDECSFVYPHDLYKTRREFDEKIFGKKLIDHETMAALIFNIGEKGSLKKIVHYIETSDLGLESAGHDYTNYLLDDASSLVQERLFPIMFVFSFLLIWFFVRSIKDAALLFIPCLFSALLSLSSIKLFFTNMNMVTSIVPLMAFVINLSLGQHIYFSATSSKNIKFAIREKVKPISLMLVTTFVGFLSLYTSEIFVIRIFGLLSAILIVVTTLISSLWLISISDYLNFKEVMNLKLSKYPTKSFSVASIIGLCLVSLILGGFGGEKVDIVTDATKYFAKDSKIQKNFQEVLKVTGGVPIAEIGFKTPEEGLDFKYRLKLAQVEDSLNSIEGVRLISQNQVIKEMNKDYAGVDALPDNHFAYTALYSKAPEGIKSAYPIGDEGYKITLLGKPVNVDQYDEMIAQVRQTLKGHDYKIDGLYYNLMISQREMVHTLAKSFLLSLLIMATIAVVSLKKLKLFVIFIVVNTLPLGLSLFFIYFFNMSLNIATVMTYSVGLGMVVDSTFHILHFLEQEEIDFQRFIETIVTPVVTSSFILIFSFSLFSLYSFLPIREFGINLAFILFCGMIFDLFVLPTMYLGNSQYKKVQYENL